MSSDIVVQARKLGVTGITWDKIGNLSMQASSSKRFLGQPNQPNGVNKNDREHILMLRKRGYCRPTPQQRELSEIASDLYA